MIIKTIEMILFRLGSNSLKVRIAKKWGVRIGKDCRLFNIKFGSEPYLISIGDHCEITSNVSFVTHDGATWVLRENNQYLGSKFGPIIVQDNCFIGINSIILPDVEIGPNSVVGAGSVVTKNIPANSVFAGNPAKFICSTEDYLYRCSHDNIGDTGLNTHRSDQQKEQLLKMFRDRFRRK